MDGARRGRMKKHQAAPSGRWSLREAADTPVWAGTSAMGIGLGLGTVVGLWTGPLGAVLGFASGVGAGVFYDRWLERSRARDSATPTVATRLGKRNASPPGDASL